MAEFTSSKEIFDQMCTRFRPEKAQGDKAVIQFDLSGEDGGKYWAKIADNTCEVGSGDAPVTADMTMLSSGENWVKLCNKQLNAMNAFMMGQIKVKGSMGLAIKLQTWFDL